MCVKQLAFMFESLIFIYVGLQFAYFLINYSDIAFSWSFFFIEITLLVVTRYFVVFFLSGITLLFRIKTKHNFYLNMHELFLLATSGMVRGSVVYAFVQYFHPHHYEDHEKTLQDFRNVELLKATALGIIIFTTFIFGGLLQPVSSFVLKKAEIEEEQQAENPEEALRQRQNSMDPKVKI